MRATGNGQRATMHFSALARLAPTTVLNVSMSRLIVVAALYLCCSALSPRSSAVRAAEVIDVVNVSIVQRLTGPAQTGSVAIGGTDLGHMVNHNGQTYFLFGDTFSGNTPPSGAIGGAMYFGGLNAGQPTWVTSEFSRR